MSVVLNSIMEIIDDHSRKVSEARYIIKIAAAMIAGRIKLAGIGLLLLFFMPPVLADKPVLNKDMSLQGGELVWRISSELGSQIMSIRERSSDEVRVSYDISNCNFCEGEEDNCDKDGVFVIGDQEKHSKLGVVCHVGAHSQRLMIFDTALNTDSPVLNLTGAYFIDYELVNNGLTIRYDVWSDANKQMPQIKTLHWPEPQLQCPQGFSASDFAKVLIKAELSGVRLLELEGNSCLSQSNFPYLLIDKNRSYDEGLSINQTVASFDDVRIIDVVELDKELYAYKVIFEVKSQNIRTGVISTDKDSIKYFLYVDKPNQETFGCGGVTEAPTKVRIMNSCLR